MCTKKWLFKILFLSIGMISLFCIGVANGKSIQSFDGHNIPFPKHLKYVSKKFSGGFPEHNKTSYPSSVLKLLSICVENLEGSARDIEGKKVKISHPVYFGKLPNGEKPSSQIILPSMLVRRSVYAMLVHVQADEDTCIQLFKAAHDLEIPSLTNALSFFLVDKKIRELQDSFYFQQIISSLLEDNTWICQFTSKEKRYVRKHLLLKKDKLYENTVADFMSTTNQVDNTSCCLNLCNRGITSLWGMDLLSRDGVKKIDLSYNRIHDLDEGLDSIYEPFRSFNEVEILNLYGNNLTRVPSELIHPLTQLKELNLGNNALSCLPPHFLDNATNLKQLYLCENKLAKLSKNDFYGLKSIRNLYLHQNDLKELPRDVFKECKNLSYLYLDHNRISSLPEHIFSHTKKLTILYLSENPLDLLYEETFKGLTKLERLELSHCKLTYLPENIFQELKSLIQLNLANNSLCTIGKGLLTGLPCLYNLRIEDNQIKQLPKGVFRFLPSLVNITIWNNPLSLSLDQFRERHNLSVEKTWIHYP